MALGLVLALIGVAGATGSLIKGASEDRYVRNSAREQYENGKRSYPIYYDSRTGEYKNIYTGVVETCEQYWEKDFNEAWKREKEFILKENPNAMAVCTHQSRPDDPIIGTIYKDINDAGKEYFIRGFHWEKDDLTQQPFDVTFGYYPGSCQAAFYMNRKGLLIDLTDECKNYLEKHNWSSGNKDMKYFGTKEDIQKFMNYVNEKQKGRYGYLMDYHGDAYRVHGNNYNKLLLSNKTFFYMNRYSCF